MHVISRAFADRLNSACDTHPHVPAKHHGRLVWLRDELARRQKLEVSMETVRRWFSGEVCARPDKMEKVAQVLGVDVAWLAMGVDPLMTSREKRIRDATADGIVNVMAGLVQMEGGTPAFPEADDRRAQLGKINLYAIIKGVAYALHVTTGEEDDNGLTFCLPLVSEGVLTIGVLRDGFNLELFEIDYDVVERYGERKGESYKVKVPDRSCLHTIRSLTERL